ncbi:MAG: hypothetical protein IPG22_18410 [Acidobacteria bacterium]|nr:hypothetical protein [Acidobacteriota bacterium]
MNPTEVRAKRRPPARRSCSSHDRPRGFARLFAVKLCFTVTLGKGSAAPPPLLGDQPIGIRQSRAAA